MQYQSENMQTSNEQMWTANEIKELIMYAQEMQQANEDLRAGIIMMQAKLDNEEAKVRKMTNLLNQILYAKGN
jgi:uncharacterized tellurite resistance protein B-like protein